MGQETHSPAAGAAGEMTLSGVEHPSKMPGNHQIRPTGGAESGALAALTLDPELARIVAAWPDLSDPIRRAVLALVGSAAAPPT